MDSIIWIAIILCGILSLSIMIYFNPGGMGKMGKIDSEPNSSNKTNLFFTELPNIFLGKNYYNYETNKPKESTPTSTSIGSITYNSWLYSKPISNKIICSNHKNIANCWEDNINNCQWVHKIDGGSYCEVGQKFFP
jgi:hypothetical protein